MNGRSANSTAIDAKTGEVVGTIALGGKPETAQADGAGHIYVNIEDKNPIVDVDSSTLKVLIRGRLRRARVLRVWPLTSRTSACSLVATTR